MNALAGGMITFLRGLLRQRPTVVCWVLLLAMLNLVVPLAYLHRIEARVTVGVFLLCGAAMAALTARYGFTRILGAGHLLWLPLVAWLATRLPLVPAGGSFGRWLRLVIVADVVSLLLDAVDVLRYLRGDRAEVVDWR